MGLQATDRNSLFLSWFLLDIQRLGVSLVYLYYFRVPLMRTITMRSMCTYLGGAVLATFFVALASGCDSGTSELETPPAPKKVDPMTDMPGLKQMQDKVKAEGKMPKTK